MPVCVDEGGWSRDLPSALSMCGASDSVLSAQMSTSDWFSLHPKSSTHRTAALTEPVYLSRVSVTASFPEVGRAIKRVWTGNTEREGFVIKHKRWPL